MLRWFSLVLPMLCLAEVPDVILDQDGGVDDLIAMALLQKSGAVHLRAVTICPADSYLEPATRATALFLDRLGARGVTIAQGHAEGVNPFPAQWRNDAGRVLGIPALAGAAAPSGANPVVAEDAAHHLVRLLSGHRRYAIVATGPLTNIADALRLRPAIQKNITRIWVMGGAVRVAGNVEQKGHDGSAEWNIFNHPPAAAEVLASGIPITLVPLDATNKTPLTSPFLARLAAQPSTASRLAAEAWRLVVEQVGGDRYYFWDTLTAAAFLDPAVVKTARLRVAVATSGASQGRTFESPAGVPVDVAVDTDARRVERMFLEILGR